MNDKKKYYSGFNLPDPVKAKKHLGQHFLKDLSIAEKISDSVLMNGYTKVLEIGPGTGILTQFLLKKPGINLTAAEIDSESVEFLLKNKEQFKGLNLIQGDILRLDWKELGSEKLAVVGNFPYNISSQILFKAFEHREQVSEITGMFQKEVAKRIVSGPGNKDYGILSVLLQAFYKTEYLFTVDEHVFSPPPKVKSGVIRLIRNEVENLPCDLDVFRLVVKMGFNQRRKMLSNALKQILPSPSPNWVELSKRAEQLSVNDFINLTEKILTSNPTIGNKKNVEKSNKHS
jgi:16S rRNA (adenine1518-N6/adenine1519-N6)-dimethyltransferase